VSAPERPPTKDELDAMAFVDGELDPAARSAFERRIAREPALAREVVALQRLELLARHAAGPEPIDHEWRRLQADAMQRASFGLGWLLLLLGGAGLFAWGAYALFASTLGMLPKLCALALGIGAALLVLRALRARMRTKPFDPYTEIRR
jgi:anti-sigma factor RsiW